MSGVSKCCGKKVILNDVSFEARAGCVTAFLSPNGAGKSSTLRILLELDYPSDGKATFGSRSMQSLKIRCKW
jgi:ABC-2 type transport system ATP-binding protein